MRKTLSLLFLIAFLGVTIPAQAQFRSDANDQRASSRLYDAGGSNFLLNTLFNPSIFKMSHSVEMSFGSYGGGTSSLGMYTNTMAWQFSDKLAARVDISAAYSPFNSSELAAFGRQQGPQVFLRNAELAWRPSENVQFHVQIRQSPYGSYASPYGYYSPYGYGGFHNTAYGHSSGDRLFWRTSR